MLLLFHSKLPEEIRKYGGTGILQDPAGIQDAMIVGKVKKRILRDDGTALRILRAKIDMPDPCLDHCRGTHIARLERDIQVAILKPPGIENATGFADRDHLCMKCDILIDLTTVIASGYDASFVNDYTTDRGFFQRTGLVRLTNSGLHKFFVICRQHIDMITRNLCFGFSLDIYRLNS